MGDAPLPVRRGDVSFNEPPVGQDGNNVARVDGDQAAEEDLVACEESAWGSVA
ncbi:hypothetical protein Sru01_50750 [Sphaerisporangium rufum]|uniref:Uncharacterized protein n=1 Tax=Sphaerisporangium rufum TaxID=1381558 RepID=A0A919R6M0_9ACTN|nr:hypothetical protein Sru01_50750 [Sphaerisporangium rufum]